MHYMLDDAAQHRANNSLKWLAYFTLVATLLWGAALPVYAQDETGGTDTTEVSTDTTSNEPNNNESNDSPATPAQPAPTEAPSNETPAEVPADDPAPANTPSSTPAPTQAPVVDDVPTEEPVVEETPTDEAPVEENTADDAPVEETPTEETVAEETPVEDTSDEQPVEDTADETVDESDVDESDVDETNVDESNVDESNVDEQPVAETTCATDDTVTDNVDDSTASDEVDDSTTCDDGAGESDDAQVVAPAEGDDANGSDGEGEPVDDLMVDDALVTVEDDADDVEATLDDVDASNQPATQNAQAGSDPFFDTDTNADGNLDGNADDRVVYVDDCANAFSLGAVPASSEGLDVSCNTSGTADDAIQDAVDYIVTGSTVQGTPVLDGDGYINLYLEENVTFTGLTIHNNTSPLRISGGHGLAVIDTSPTPGTSTLDGIISILNSSRVIFENINFAPTATVSLEGDTIVEVDLVNSNNDTLNVTASGTNNQLIVNGDGIFNDTVVYDADNGASDTVTYDMDNANIDGDAVEGTITDSEITIGLNDIAATVDTGAGANDTIIIDGEGGTDNTILVTDHPSANRADISTDEISMQALNAENIDVNTDGGTNTVTVAPDTTIDIDVTGAGGDTLNINGSSNSETVTFNNAQVAVTGQQTVDYTGVTELNFNMGTGNDTVNVDMGNDMSGITVSINGSGATDTLNINGDNDVNNITVTPTEITIDDAGTTASYSGIETININGDVVADDNILFVGTTAGAENMNYNPDTGEFTATTFNADVNLNNTNSVEFDGNGGSSALTFRVEGAGADIIEVTQDATQYTATINGTDFIARDFIDILVNANGGGNDVTTLNPDQYTLGASIRVGGSGGSEVVILNGTTGADSFDITLSGINATINTGADTIYTFDVPTIDVDALGNGNDSLTVIGDTNANAFTINQFDVTIDNLTDITFDATLENLTVEAGNGDDSFAFDYAVTYGNLVSITIDGNAGTDVVNLTGTVNNDTFNVDQTTFSINPTETVDYANIDTINLTADTGADILNLLGGVGDDDFAITATSVTSVGLPDIVHGGGAELETINLDGADDVDNYDIELGIYTGTLVISDNQAENIYNVTTSLGTLTLDLGTTSITDGSNTLDYSTSTIGEINFTAAGDDITILGTTDDDTITSLGAGVLAVSSTATGFDDFDLFINAPTSLAIQTLDGDDQVTLLAGDYLGATISFNGGLDEDTFVLTMPTGTYSVDAMTAGTLAMTGDITRDYTYIETENLIFDGTTSTTTYNLNPLENITQTVGADAGNSVKVNIDGQGNYITNNDDTLSDLSQWCQDDSCGTVYGDISYTDGDLGADSVEIFDFDMGLGNNDVNEIVGNGNGELLTALSNWGDNVDEHQLMDELLSGIAWTLGDVIDLGGAFEHLRLYIEDALTTTTTVAGLLAAIGAAGVSFAGYTAPTLDILDDSGTVVGQRTLEPGSYTFNPPPGNERIFIDPASRADLFFDLDFTHTRNTPSDDGATVNANAFDLDLGGDIDTLGIILDNYTDNTIGTAQTGDDLGNNKVTTVTTFNFASRLSIQIGNTTDAYAELQDTDTSIAVDKTAFNADVAVGFLDANVTGGNVDMDAELNYTFNAGYFEANVLSGSNSANLTINAQAVNVGTTQYDVDLPLSVDNTPGTSGQVPLDAAFVTLMNSDTPQIQLSPVVTGADVFDRTAIDFSIPAKYETFTALSSQDALSFIIDFNGFLNSFMASPVFDQPVPLAGGFEYVDDNGTADPADDVTRTSDELTLGDIYDFGDLFGDILLAPEFGNGILVITAQDEVGAGGSQPTGSAGGPWFDSLQTMINRLNDASSLDNARGAGGVGVQASFNYSAGVREEITFRLEMSRALTNAFDNSFPFDVNLNLDGLTDFVTDGRLQYNPNSDVALSLNFGYSLLPVEQADGQSIQPQVDEVPVSIEQGGVSVNFIELLQENHNELRLGKLDSGFNFDLTVDGTTQNVSVPALAGQVYFNSSDPNDDLFEGCPEYEVFDGSNWNDWGGEGTYGTGCNAPDPNVFPDPFRLKAIPTPDGIDLQATLAYVISQVQSAVDGAGFSDTVTVTGNISRYTLADGVTDPDTVGLSGSGYLGDLIPPFDDTAVDTENGSYRRLLTDNKGISIQLNFSGAQPANNFPTNGVLTDDLTFDVTVIDSGGTTTGSVNLSAGATVGNTSLADLETQIELQLAGQGLGNVDVSFDQFNSNVTTLVFNHTAPSSQFFLEFAPDSALVTQFGYSILGEARGPEQLSGIVNDLSMTGDFELRESAVSPFDPATDTAVYGYLGVNFDLTGTGGSGDALVTSATNFSTGIMTNYMPVETFWDTLAGNLVTFDTGEALPAGVTPQGTTGGVDNNQADNEDYIRELEARQQLIDLFSTTTLTQDAQGYFTIEVIESLDGTSIINDARIVFALTQGTNMLTDPTRPIRNSVVSDDAQYSDISDTSEFDALNALEVTQILNASGNPDAVLSNWYNHFGETTALDFIVGFRDVHRLILNELQTNNDIEQILFGRLPFLGVSVNDVVDYATYYRFRMDTIALNPPPTLQDLEASLDFLFNLSVRVSAQQTGAEYNVIWRVSYGVPGGGSYLMNVDLPGLIPFIESLDQCRDDDSDFDSTGVCEAADDGGTAYSFDDMLGNVLVGTEQTAEIDLLAQAIVDLYINFDLADRVALPGETDPDAPKVARASLDPTQSNIVLSVYAKQENLDFSANIGLFQGFVRNGSIEINAEYNVDFNDSLTWDMVPSGPVEDWFTTDMTGIGGVGEAFAEINLPLFYPAESRRVATLNIRIANDGTDDDLTSFILENGGGGAVDSQFVNIIYATAELCPDDDWSGDKECVFGGTPAGVTMLGLLLNPDIFIEGLDNALYQIQAMLESFVYNVDIPLIGDALFQEPANFIEGFREEVLAEVYKVLPDGDSESVVGLVVGKLYELFGTDGIVDWTNNTFFGAPLLRGYDTDTVGIFNSADLSDPTNDIKIFTNGSNTAGTPDSVHETRGCNVDATFCEIDFRLGGSYSWIPVDAGSVDLGLPALGLEIDATIEFTFDWSFRFGFGVALGGTEVDQGFYFKTDREEDFQGTPTDTSDDLQNYTDDIGINFTASLNGSSFRAQLGPVVAGVYLEDLTVCDITDSANYDPVACNAMESVNVDLSILNICDGVEGIDPRCNGTYVNGTYDDDGTADIDTGFQADANRTSVDLYFGVDFADPNGEGRWTLPELLSIRRSNYQEYFEDDGSGNIFGTGIKYGGKVIIDLDLLVGFDPDLNDGRANTDMAFPQVRANFYMERIFGEPGPSYELDERCWDGLPLGAPAPGTYGAGWFEVTAGVGADLGKNCYLFRDIELDLGGFITDFIAPVMGEVKDVLEEFDWLIGEDGVLRSEIPVISQLAGKPVTVLSLVQLAEEANPKIKVTPFINAAIAIYDLATNFPTDGNAVLRYAAYNLSDWNMQTDFGLRYVGPVPELNIDVEVQDGPNKRYIGKLRQTEGMKVDFPIFSTDTVYKLLLGRYEEVDIFKMRLPKFEFMYYYKASFRIYGPLVATLSGEFRANIDLGFGYDALGIVRFTRSGDPLDFTDGFYIDDFDWEGRDIPELTAVFEIAAGAGLDFGIASAGVEGGITLIAEMNLADPNKDGKIRFTELAASTEALFNGGGPPCPFDFTLRSEWFFRAYFELKLGFVKISKRFEFGRGELLPPVEWECDQNPFLGSIIEVRENGESFGVLNLHVGNLAANRMYRDYEDGAENFTVVENGGDFDLTLTKDGETYTQTLTVTDYIGSSVRRIIADAGIGNDTIDASGVNSAIVEFTGGEGNDTLIAGNGAPAFFGRTNIFGRDLFGYDEAQRRQLNVNFLDGGVGNDTLTGGSSRDFLYGSNGDDILNGGGGADYLFGGAGNDILNGNGGNDVLEGESGTDHNNGGAGDDTFVFNSYWGNDTVFETNGQGSDTIDMSGVNTDIRFSLGDPYYGVNEWLYDLRVDNGLNGYLPVLNLADQFEDDGLTVTPSDPNFGHNGFNIAATDLFGNSVVTSTYNAGVITNTFSVERLIGGFRQDVYEVYNTADQGSTNATTIYLDGGKSSDTYIAYGETDIGGGQIGRYDVILEDNGGIWNTDLAIAYGTPNDDTINVDDQAVTFILSTPPNSVFGYNRGFGIEQLEVYGMNGDDEITVESTPGRDSGKDYPTEIGVTIFGDEPPQADGEPITQSTNYRIFENGVGNDTIVVGGMVSNSPYACGGGTQTYNTLNNICGGAFGGNLTILGGSVIDPLAVGYGTSDIDRLIIRDEDPSTFNNVGSIEQGAVIGFGMQIDIDFDFIESLEFLMGDGDDEVDVVESLVLNPFDRMLLWLGEGDDKVTLNTSFSGSAIGVKLQGSIYGEGGDDYIYMYDDARILRSQYNAIP
jgi:hypothetical protein